MRANIYCTYTVHVIILCMYIYTVHVIILCMYIYFFHQHTVHMSLMSHAKDGAQLIPKNSKSYHYPPKRRHPICHPRRFRYPREQRWYLRQQRWYPRQQRWHPNLHLGQSIPNHHVFLIWNQRFLSFQISNQKVC